MNKKNKIENEHQAKVRIVEKILKWIKDNFYKFMSILIIICSTLVFLAAFGGFKLLIKLIGG